MFTLKDFKTWKNAKFMVRLNTNKGVLIVDYDDEIRAYTVYNEKDNTHVYSIFDVAILIYARNATQLIERLNKYLAS